MDIKQINTAIITQTWTNDELNSMIDAIKYARVSLLKQNIRAITLQSNVEFELRRLLEKEIHYHVKVELEKRELE